MSSLNSKPGRLTAIIFLMWESELEGVFLFVAINQVMKHQWRKDEKSLYLPPRKPQRLQVPALKFFTIRGEGNPNGEDFEKHVGVLYSLAYAVKMSPKKGKAPEGYFDYTVYPLEGVWDISEEAKKSWDGTLDKNSLVYTIMIRQPDFVNDEFADFAISNTMEKKPDSLLDKVRFEVIEEGDCIQMLHLGSYDDEPATFEVMERYATEHGLQRVSKVHREIYLSDARRVAPEKLKTVLRFKVK